MSKNIGNNELCWCGSGIKYKKCHRNRDQEKEIQSYEIKQDHQKVFSFQECKVPNELKCECEGSIIRAHTISRSANLKEIQKDGHVYTLNIDYGGIKENPKNVHLDKKGIKKDASTFYIFCKYHDDKLFAPLEKKDFTFTNEQIFLLSYRIIAKGLYLKERQIYFFSEHVKRNYDKGLSREKQLFIQTIGHIFSDEDSQIKDIQNVKNLLDEKLINKEYSNIKYYALIIDKIPEIMVAGAFIPDIDFYGNDLIDYVNNYNREYNVISVSSIKVNDNQGAIIFSWDESIDSTECDIFINDLVYLTNQEKIKAITCLFFKKLKESLCISPNWYESLAEKNKLLIDTCYIYDKKLNINKDMISEILEKQLSIIPSFSHDIEKEELMNILNNIPISDDSLNEFEKFDFFDWNIVDIKTNM